MRSAIGIRVHPLKPALRKQQCRRRIVSVDRCRNTLKESASDQVRRGGDCLPDQTHSNSPAAKRRDDEQIVDPGPFCVVVLQCNAAHDIAVHEYGLPPHASNDPYVAAPERPRPWADTWPVSAKSRSCPYYISAGEPPILTGETRIS